MLISILLWLLFGAFIGWIAGMIMKKKSSLLGNIIFGIIGSFVGGFVASIIGFGSLRGSFSFDLMNVIFSVAGACLVIFIAGILKPEK
ncbi:MAG: GlsB/YeaQ/YmgE family stress response membrane protein [Oscillospiraceae bacterium]|nr:GlsB/YeaQ/YmgE family stress response membrane protein [Oscillospiraceae bacterium]